MAALPPNGEVLRRASGDAVGGSRLSDLARAITRLYGWRPKFSPDGGERLTWTGPARAAGQRRRRRAGR
jgi:hypothetical protein